jgi:hypothetical protein
MEKNGDEQQRILDELDERLRQMQTDMEEEEEAERVDGQSDNKSGFPQFFFCFWHKKLKL